MSLLYLVAAQALLALSVLSNASSSRHRGNHLYSSRFPGVVWNNEAWTLTHGNASNNDWLSLSLVGNGYIGSSFVASGPFPRIWPESSGNPMYENRSTFGTVAGFFDKQPTVGGDWYSWLSQYGGDSVISGLPSWGPLVLDLGNGTFLDGNVDTTELSNVVLKQDYARGFAGYSYRWSPRARPEVKLDLSYTVLADKLYPNRAYVDLQVTAVSGKAVHGTVVDILDGSVALRTGLLEKGRNGSAMYTAVRPNGVDDVAAWMYSTLNGTGVDPSAIYAVSDRSYINQNTSTVAQGIDIKLQPNCTISITKFVGIASTDAFENPQHQAYQQMKEGSCSGFQDAFARHVEEWAAVFPRSSASSFADPDTGLIPDHLVDRQITTVVASAVLLMHTVGENATKSVSGAPVNNQGISVCGFFSDCYGGQRFWDQDVWMAPYLAAAHPFEAKQIALVRVLQYPQAKENIKTAYTGSRNHTYFSPDAAIYAWSVGRQGNCSALGPCWDNEYHVNGDIIRNFITYWVASGDDDLFDTSLLPVAQSIATLFSNLLSFNETTQQWWLKNMTDPDEYASFIDNGAFTMSLVQWTLSTIGDLIRQRGDFAVNETWFAQANAVDIPQSPSGITLEYLDMPGDVTAKQVDVNLRTYFLNNLLNYSTADQRADLNYYASKMSASGPAMTWAIFSAVSSLISPSGCSSYTYDLNSWSPYLQPPYYTFTEGSQPGSGASPSYPFLTGYGGFLQIDLMGYLGLRYESPGKMQLHPNLPPQVPYLRFPTFYFRGWPITAEANQNGTTLKRLSRPLSTADVHYAIGPIPIELWTDIDAQETKILQLAPDESVFIPNSNISSTLTSPGNILQCRPVVSYSSNGPLPQAAIDGSTGTRWEIVLANVTTGLTVDLQGAGSGIVDELHVDWASSPAQSFTVIFHNDSSTGSCLADGEDCRRLHFGNVSISLPYDQGAAGIVQPYKGNSTNVSLAEWKIWTSRYFTFMVDGSQNQESDGEGATVAELALSLAH